MTRYLGWANNETWRMALWVNNDESIVTLKTQEERIEAVHALRTFLEDETDSTPNAILKDFLTYGIWEVHWDEIVSHLLED